MPEVGKQEERGEKIHQIRWDAGHADADWDRIVHAAEVLSAQEHLDLGPTDIIRKGTRSLLDALLGPASPVESLTIAEQRTGQDRRRVG